MKIFRGPKTKAFLDGSHGQVAKVSPDALEVALREKSPIQFNVTKTYGAEKESVCTAFFEEADLLPMMRGLLGRMEKQQARVARIRKLVGDPKLTDAVKLQKITSEIARLL